MTSPASAPAPAFPRLGTGVGLRPKHYGEILTAPRTAARVDWFEAISENFMVPGGKPLHVLEKIRSTHPVVLHGVSLSIGSADPLNDSYLDALAALVERIEPAIVSDHLCWGSVDGRYAHDLLPLPCRESEVERIAARISRVQERLGRRILVENVSSYLAWRRSEMSEWEFLAAIAERADCGILLDVNNVFVSARNQRFDPVAYLEGIPRDRVGQFHLAGHTDRDRYLFDSHDGPVIDPVWSLYEKALARFGPAATLIEWDDKLPDFSRLCDEADSARERQATACDPSPGATGETPSEIGRAGTATATESRTIGNSGVGSERQGQAHSRSRSPKKDPSIDEAAVDPARDQRIFWNLLTSTRATAAASQLPAPGQLILDDHLSAADRLDIYAGMYFARFHDTLLEDFPAVEACLGHARFHEKLSAYVAACPSRHPSLRHYGDRFPEFLRTHPESSTPDPGARASPGSAPPAPLLLDPPWIAELAALEWARVEAFDAKDAATLDPHALAELPPERWASLRFQPHPAVRFVSCAWRVDLPWKQVDTGMPPDPPPASAGGIRVWREKNVVFHAWTEPMETDLLEGLVAGRDFAALCERAARHAGGDPDDAAAVVLRILRVWLGDGILSELD